MTHELGPRLTRDEVLDRARTWLQAAVPYSQTSFHSNEHGRYRTDCSGYVSMAWALPQNRHGGLDTPGLATVSHPIDKKDLSPGDVLLRTDGTHLTRHVTLFAAWATETRDAYWAFEQAGATGTTHRLIPYPHDDPGPYRPHRYLRLS